MEITWKVLFRIYYILMAVSIVIGLLMFYFHLLHYHYRFQYIPAFFAIFGFVGCALLILIAKGMGHWLVVEEDYYEKH